MSLKRRLRLDSDAEVHWYGPTWAQACAWRPMSPFNALLVSVLIAVRTYQQIRAKKPTAPGQQRLLIQLNNFMPRLYTGAKQ